MTDPIDDECRTHDQPRPGQRIHVEYDAEMYDAKARIFVVDGAPWTAPASATVTAIEDDSDRTSRPPSLLSQVIHYPSEAHIIIAGRFACRVLRIHNITCRGRADHWPSKMSRRT
jgi:hypothetical protein